MTPHLTWSDIDAWVRGRLEGPREVHLAECGDCAAKITRLREEEEAIRGALAPPDDSEEDVEALLARLPAAAPRPSRAGVVPLLAASLLVGLLILVLTSTRTPRPTDPMAAAIDAGDVERYGWKAARHVPAARAAELRRTPVRVLYAEGESRNEYRMLRPALLKDPGLLVHTMLLNSRDADLYGKSEAAGSVPPRFRDIATIFPLSDDDLIDYDVIILGEVEARRLSSSADVVSSALSSFVTRLGGTLVLIAGPKTAPADIAHAVADLLPVDLAGAAPVAAEAAVTGGTIRWHLRATPRKGATTIVATKGGDPIVAECTSGRGRVVFVASDDFWSWGPERQYAFYRGLITR